MQSIEAFLFIEAPDRIFLFFHRPFHRAVEMVPSPLQRLYQNFNAFIKHLMSCGAHAHRTALSRMPRGRNVLMVVIDCHDDHNECRDTQDD